MIMYGLPLHMLWLMATTTQISWAKGNAPASKERITMERLPWLDNAEDRQYVRMAYEQSAALRLTPTSPGTYVLNDGDVFEILSENHPSDYPTNAFQKWIFEPAPDVKITMECPTIRIPPSPRCKKDKFVIFKMPRFRRGTRRCGRINNFMGEWETKIKVIFRSNSDSETGSGISCQVRGVSTLTTTSSTTTSTTTTVMPGCPAVLEPMSPSPVTNCSELDPVFSSNCECSECDGQMILKCAFCTLCDFDLFAAHDFMRDIVLEPHFNCSYPMDISGSFHHNADMIRGLRFCVEEDMSHIAFPYAELTNLTGLYYQDCSNTTQRACLYDPCGSDDVCRTGPESPSLTVPSPWMEQVYPVSLPSSSDTPNLLELYLADVNISLDGSKLSYSQLEKVCINSHETEINPGTFADLTELQQAFVEICQSNLVEGDFNMTSSVLDCLEIVDTCTHLIESDSISLSGGCNPANTTVSITTTQDFITYVPKCPFMPLVKMDCVHINWFSQTLCRSCGNYWLWSLTPSRLSTVTNQCYDALTDTVSSLEDYVTNNALLPSCNFPVVPC